MSERLDVRELATERGLSLRQLAGDAGIPYGSISRVLNGGMCRVEWRDAIAKVLKVEPAALDLRVPGHWRKPAAEDPLPPVGPKLPQMPALLVGLFEELPPPHSVWPGPARRAWFELAERVFTVVYRDEAFHDPASQGDTPS
jgi:lambda repressor-like predicted transcriptional regulator